MPKPQRKPEEIEAVKDDILNHAMQLIIQEGYDGFSMRKLAARLGIAAKTIYNYYTCKDEIYLLILTKGFELLHHQCRTACLSQTRALDRINAIIRAYLEFGLRETGLYNLMFTWHVPKYNDYLGTLMEPAAKAELETAMQVKNLFVNTIQACVDRNMPISEEKAGFLMITIWTQLHGFISGYNNTLLDYICDNPISFKEKILNIIMDNFQRELKGMNRAKVVPIQTGKDREEAS